MATMSSSGKDSNVDIYAEAQERMPDARVLRLVKTYASPALDERKLAPGEFLWRSRYLGIDFAAYEACCDDLDADGRHTRKKYLIGCPISHRLERDFEAVLHAGSGVTALAVWRAGWGVTTGITPDGFIRGWAGFACYDTSKPARLSSVLLAALLYEAEELSATAAIRRYYRIQMWAAERERHEELCGIPGFIGFTNAFDDGKLSRIQRAIIAVLPKCMKRLVQMWDQAHPLVRGGSLKGARRQWGPWQLEGALHRGLARDEDTDDPINLSILDKFITHLGTLGAFASFPPHKRTPAALRAMLTRAPK